MCSREWAAVESCAWSLPGKLFHPSAYSGQNLHATRATSRHVEDLDPMPHVLLSRRQLSPNALMK